ncbi:hypothetical protein AB0M23_28375 [Streptomyces sp. NPDC052077]|uniref:hypothetical protein n=1 Tax=Streptomyces sp. NPDC052077 TaxID=3154757 RepID=UPI003448366A
MADEPTTTTDRWVEMIHPELPGSPPAAASRAAFALVWEPLGWELYVPLAAGEAPAAETVAAPEPGPASSTTDAASRRRTAAPAAKEG